MNSTTTALNRVIVVAEIAIKDVAISVRFRVDCAADAGPSC